jgi:hypothetical protein
MSELQLTLSGDERDFLAEILERRLQEKRVEEHRTRAPSYRKNVLQEEELIAGLLNKLGHATTAAVPGPHA